MLILPKIVIKNGQSLHQFTSSDIDASPASIAAQMSKLGFSWLYVQFLDDPLSDENKNALDEIFSRVSVPIWIEGPVASMTMVDELMAEGISRLTLNNLALSDHNFIKQASEYYPDQIALHLHAEGNKVEQFDLSKLIETVSNHELCALFYSETISSDDSALSKPGLDLSSTTALAKKTSIPFYYAGPINYVEDLLSLASEHDTGLSGCLIGEALYNEQISSQDALQIASGISLYQQKSNDN